MSCKNKHAKDLYKPPDIDSVNCEPQRPLQRLKHPEFSLLYRIFFIYTIFKIGTKLHPGLATSLVGLFYVSKENEILKIDTNDRSYMS